MVGDAAIGGELACVSINRHARPPGMVSSKGIDMALFSRVMMNSLGAVFVSCMLAICADARADAQVETELRALQKEWAKARIEGDVKFLERFYAKEFWITSMNGSVVSRAADIAVFASRDMKPETILDEDMKVTAYENFAIVTGREILKGTYKGIAGDFVQRFTNVYVRRDGRWQMITHHATEIPK
jgi:ketosteroid isomerase-like protein